MNQKTEEYKVDILTRCIKIIKAQRPEIPLTPPIAKILGQVYDSINEVKHTLTREQEILKIIQGFLREYGKNEVIGEKMVDSITILEQSLAGGLGNVSEETKLIYGISKIGVDVQVALSSVIGNTREIVEKIFEKSKEYQEESTDLFKIYKSLIGDIYAHMILSSKKIQDGLDKISSGRSTTRFIVIHIDSTQRDITQYLNPCDYSMSIDSISSAYGGIKSLGIIKKIVGISLISVEFPNIVASFLPGRSGPRYIYLNIDEFPEKVFTSTANGLKMFAKVQLDQNISETAAYITTEYGLNHPLGHIDCFDNPIPQLKKLTIKWYDSDGILIDIGSDNILLNTSVPGVVNTLITTATNHNLVSGDKIYIRECDIISFNRVEGFVVSPITVTQFQITMPSTVPLTQGYFLNAVRQNSFTIQFEIQGDDF